VVGHGIPDAVLHGLQRAMDDFFAQPLAAKQRWRPPSPAINRGYTSPLSERLSYSAGVASAADLFEAFNVGAACSDFPQLGLDPVTYAENIWPDDVPGFRPAVQAWFDEAGRLARRLTRLFALALGLPAGHFEAFEDHSIDVLRLNHYALPEGIARVEPDQLGMGAHTDYGIVTVLWADPVSPGLQVQTPDGRWIDATPQPGALMVNLGDLTARWTGGRWTSSLHRVLPPLGADGRVMRRRSAAFFHDGNADAVIDTLPTCQGEPGASLEPISVAEHLRRKLAGSRGLQLNEAAAAESARILRWAPPPRPAPR
jgi:isopenicillin N synthase-like dioxygenase